MGVGRACTHRARGTRSLHSRCAFALPQEALAQDESDRLLALKIELDKRQHEQVCEIVLYEFR